jgi:hypothetical protein
MKLTEFSNFFGLGFHPAKEAFIFAIDNLWAFSFRKKIIDYLSTPIHFFAQAVPFVDNPPSSITLFLY